LVVSWPPLIQDGSLLQVCSQQWGLLLKLYAKNGRPCSGCSLTILGKCRNPHNLNAQHDPADPPPRRRVRLGRAAPEHSNLPDPPSPRRWASFSLSEPALANFDERGVRGFFSDALANRERAVGADMLLLFVMLPPVTMLPPLVLTWLLFVLTPLLLTTFVIFRLVLFLNVVMWFFLRLSPILLS